ncbi:hypothetical protein CAUPRSCDRAFT_1491, partial [Caulochytrium protostelioides]
RAIQEVASSPVVERSVTIAAISTKELVTKDFAFEPDEHKMANAAHLMACSLAGSLAAVSSREPLRVAMAAHLRQMLTQAGYTEQVIPEPLIFMVVNSNLDLSRFIIEKAASEKSAPEIDRALNRNYLQRRKHRQQVAAAAGGGGGANPPPVFYDIAAVPSPYQTNLPDALRPMPNGLNAAQLRVYEDFA